MDQDADRRFWRDPRWWVSFELGIAVVAIAISVFLRLAQPVFIGFGPPPDTTAIDLLAGLGFVVGLVLMVRFAHPRV